MKFSLIIAAISALASSISASLPKLTRKDFDDIIIIENGEAKFRHGFVEQFSLKMAKRFRKIIKNGKIDEDYFEMIIEDLNKMVDDPYYDPYYGTLDGHEGCSIC